MSKPRQFVKEAATILLRSVNSPEEANERWRQIGKLLGESCEEVDRLRKLLIELDKEATENYIAWEFQKGNKLTDDDETAIRRESEVKLKQLLDGAKRGVMSTHKTPSVPSSVDCTDTLGQGYWRQEVRTKCWQFVNTKGEVVQSISDRELLLRKRVEL